MPTIPVLCLYYAYYGCTMPTLPVLCLFITTRKRVLERESCEKVVTRLEREREEEINFLKSGFVCVNARGQIHLMSFESL